jgi:hypothetical protein
MILAMLSMTFALLRSYTALSFWEVMVAVMSLDITSAIVQMALSQKETLASRWWVTLCAISQSLVQASLGIVLGKMFPFSSAQQDPCQKCVRAVWWGTFDSCKEVPWAFCIYWVVRGLLVMRSCAIGLHHMHYYDLGERIARGEKSSQEISRSSRLIRFLTLTDLVNEKTPTTPSSAREIKVWSPEAFPRMPATTLTDWILWTLPAIGAMSSLERMLSLFELSNPGNMKDWGQTTTFMAVICGLVARAIYLFYAKLKRRSCLERAKAAVDLSNSNSIRKKTLYAGNFVSFKSKYESFRDIQRVLQPIDCVRWQLPQEVWYQHIDLEKAEEEFLRSAVLNDSNGLLEWAKYLPDLSTAVDDTKRTALHIALDKQNIEAIETIMGLIDPEPQPGESSASASTRWERLLDASDIRSRTPWRMIVPSGLRQMKTEIVGAALRFKYPVRHPDRWASSSQIINRIFTLPYYSLEVIEAWSRAAKESQSLRQLEDSIIQAVGADCCSFYSSEILHWCKNTWEFCCLKFDDLDGIQFATRLLKALMHSPRCRSTSPHVASRLAQLVKQKRVWTTELYADIAQIVATYGDSLDDMRLLVKQCPQNTRIGEQVLVGAVANLGIGENIIIMMMHEWPEKADITPKVLQTCLINPQWNHGSCSLEIFLTEQPHQIQLTESIVMFAAQARRSIGIWSVLIEKYRSQIEMTQNVFDTLINAWSLTPDNHLRAAKLLRTLLTEWPHETRITNKTVLRFVHLDRCIWVFQLFHELRRDELRTAIDSQLLVELATRCLYKENHLGDLAHTSDLVELFLNYYPQECKAAITDEVLEQAKACGGRVQGMRIKDYGLVDSLEALRQGSAPPWLLA